MNPKSSLKGAKMYIYKKSNDSKIPAKVSGNPALVSEERVFHTGWCVQANSLRGREGRGKLSARSRSGQCV